MWNSHLVEYLIARIYTYKYFLYLKCNLHSLSKFESSLIGPRSLIFFWSLKFMSIFNEPLSRLSSLMWLLNAT